MSHKIPSTVYWYTTKKPHPDKGFSGKIKSTVAVIGGGMAGLSCAQKLHQASVPVVVIEKDFCGSGASGKTSGFITPDSEIELSALIDEHGTKKAKRIWEFVVSGVEIIRDNIQRHKITCDYQVQDSLFIANSAHSFRHVKKEHQARQHLGYTSTLYDNTSIKEIISSEEYAGAVRYPDTFGMNSYLYCLSMRDQLRATGVPIYEQTTINNIHEQISADHIIVCTDRSIPDMGALKKEIYHIQTFLGITKPLPPQQIKKIFPGKHMMVWDTDLVYNYFRITGDGRLLIGGGDLLYTYARELSDNTARFGKRLESYIQNKFPSLDLEMEYVWPGMLGVSKDLLPIMGPAPHDKKIWYVGAATGLPWAAALGFYAAERVLNDRQEFDEDFSPHRHFAIGPRMQSLLSTPVTYALSHGIVKYL